jgi:hypothetical protein
MVQNLNIQITSKNSFLTIQIGKKLKQVLLEGGTFPLSPISVEERKWDLDFHLDRGNHKSAVQNKKTLDDLIDKGIKHRFALPLPIQSLFSIPNASIAPLGCQEQETINTNDERIPQFSMTHDQTFPGPSRNSINLRVIKEDLPPCVYSFVLSRILHDIVDLRYRHPQTKIFLCKFDIDSAYHRCHLSSSTASESMTIYGDLLLITLRLTFGGSPCPPLWGLISETMINVCNSLIINKLWDHEKLFDLISGQLNEIISLRDATHFHPAKELSVKLPQSDIGLADIYIDDSIGVAPDVASNPTRVNRAIALAINPLARPLEENDPIPMISKKRLLAEGRMDECKIILGWKINTRSLQISLPLDKHLKWIYQINSIISNKRVQIFQVNLDLFESY